MYCKFVLCAVFLWGVTAFEEYPFTPIKYDNNVDVFVDCTSGSDYTGDGSAGAPYLTIANAMTQNPILASTFNIVIRNGPCPESQITLQQGYTFEGDGASTRPKITNGFSYTSPGNEFLDFVFINLEIGTLSIDDTYISGLVNTQGLTQQVFYNCKINGGSITGAVAFGQYTASFYGCDVTLGSITGFINFYDSNVGTLGNIGAQSSVLFQGGTFAGNPIVGDGTSLRMNSGSVNTAALQCTGTSPDRPLVILGKMAGTGPSQTGCTVINHDDTYNSRHLFGSNTIGGLGTTAISVGPIYGNFNVIITPTSATGTAFWVTGKTGTGFVVHGVATATFDWTIVKA